MVNFKDIKFSELQSEQKTKWTILCNKFQAKKREVANTITDAQKELPKTVSDGVSIVQRKFLTSKLEYTISTMNILNNDLKTLSGNMLELACEVIYEED